MTTSGSTPALEGLAELARQQVEHDGLVAQLAVARHRLDAAAARCAETTGTLAVELEDVARLEQVSVTRILASLRGRRDLELDRERAEADAARYAATEAESRRRYAQADVDSLVARLASLGDLALRRTHLLIAREAEVAADPAAREAATELDQVTTTLGTLQAERQQLEEAIAAVGVAGEILLAASRHLRGAGDWAAVDTFLGGGLMTDMIKYDRLDQAGELMRRADAALGHLATELADVGLREVGGIDVDALTGFFDVWFDNVFSDWAVLGRIQQAEKRLARACAGVGETAAILDGRLTACDAGIEHVQKARETLLGIRLA